MSVIKKPTFFFEVTSTSLLVSMETVDNTMSTFKLIMKRNCHIHPREVNGPFCQLVRCVLARATHVIVFIDSHCFSTPVS
jgi:hypothetical protein